MFGFLFKRDKTQAEQNISSRRLQKIKAGSSKSLQFEFLESRQMLSTFTWVGGAGSYWGTGANWQGGVAPSGAAPIDLIFQGSYKDTYNNLPTTFSSIKFNSSNFVTF